MQRCALLLGGNERKRTTKTEELILKCSIPVKSRENSLRVN